LTGKVENKLVLQTFVNETYELVTSSTSDGQEWGANGKASTIRTYVFGDKAIRVDSLGHVFPDGGTIGRHMNAGDWVDDIAKLISNGTHYFF
jgi:hypothetical protein